MPGGFGHEKHFAKPLNRAVARLSGMCIPRFRIDRRSSLMHTFPKKKLSDRLVDVQKRQVDLSDSEIGPTCIKN